MIPKIHHCRVQIRMITVYIFRLFIFLGVKDYIKTHELLRDVSLGGILTCQAQTNSAVWKHIETLSSLQWQKALPIHWSYLIFLSFLFSSLFSLLFSLLFFRDIWPFRCWTFRTLLTRFKFIYLGVLSFRFSIFGLITWMCKIILKVPKLHTWLNKE